MCANPGAPMATYAPVVGATTPELNCPANFSSAPAEFAAWVSAGPDDDLHGRRQDQRPAGAGRARSRPARSRRSWCNRSTSRSSSFASSRRSAPRQFLRAASRPRAAAAVVLDLGSATISSVGRRSGVTCSEDDVSAQVVPPGAHGGHVRELRGPRGLALASASRGPRRSALGRSRRLDASARADARERCSDGAEEERDRPARAAATEREQAQPLLITDPPGRPGPRRRRKRACRRAGSARADRCRRSCGGRRARGRASPFRRAGRRAPR
jgi:hypothetical protein